MKSYRSEDKWFAVIIAAVFLILSSAVIFLTWRSYQSYYEQFEKETNARLTAVAELKAQEVSLWRNERLADAAIFYHNELFAELVITYFDNPDDADAKRQLQGWLEQYTVAYQYQKLLLLDREGAIKLSWPVQSQGQQWAHYGKLGEIELLDKVVAIDLHLGQSGNAHLSIAVPIKDPQSDALLGLVVMQIDPHIYLYPTLQELPILGESSELLLMRQEGDYLLLLNNPDPDEDTALKLKLPLGQTACAMPPIGANQTAVASGIDYQGRDVVAATHLVSGSDWLLTACVERDSLYAATQERGQLVAELTGLLILFLATSGVLIWRWPQSHFYKQKYEAEQALRAAEAQAKAEADLLRNLGRQAPGVLYQYRQWPDGRASIPYASEGIRTVFEVAPEEVREDAAPVFARIHPDDRGQVVADIAASFANGRPWQSIFRVVLPERGERWLEGAATPEKLTDGSVLWHGITTDITERKKLEVELTRVVIQFTTAEAVAHFGVWEMELESGDCVWSDEFFRICGIEPGSIQPTAELGMQIIHPDDRERAGAAVQKAIDEGGVYNVEKRIVRPDGEIRAVQSVGSVIGDESGAPFKLAGVFLDITEHQEAQKALKASERRYRRLFETAQDAILIADDNGRYLDVNPSASQMTGYSQRELLQMSVNDLAVATVVDQWDDFMETGAQSGEITLRHKDGRLIYTEFRAVTQFMPGRHVATLRDITGRKEAEAALQASELRYSRLFETAQDAILIADDNGRYLDANPAACQITGYSRDELLQMDATKLVVAVAKERWAKFMETGTQSGEITLRHKEGHPVYAEYRAVAQFMPGCHFSVIRDITEQKQYERERQEAANRYQALFEQAHDAVGILDFDGRHLHANQRAADLLGYTLEELLSLSNQNVTAEPEQSVAMRQRLLAGDYIPTYERLLKRKDGSLVAVEVNAELVRDLDGNPLHIQSVMRDVSERKQAEQELRESHENLSAALKALQDAQKQLIQQERLAAVGQLAAGIAHDFNNILAVILLYAQMMTRSKNMPDWEHEAATTIEKQTKHAAQLVQQVLDFSRRSMLERLPLDWLPTIKEQVKLLQRTLPEDIALELQVDAPGPYMVNADSARLQQMVLNLALNGRDAMPNGGKLIIALDKIHLADKQNELEAGDWVQLKIQDSGEGIPPEAQPYIFEPFFTTKGPGKGSGLGLAQAQGIVAQHDGRMKFKSAVGQGSTFTVYLPATAAFEQSEGDVAILAQIGAEEVALLVEDNESVREALIASLEQLNYRVIATTNGREALAQLEQQAAQIDVILSDMIMPVMGGAELFQEIRQRGWQIPMIILTGHYMDEKLAELTAQGLSGWLPKPISLEKLAELMENTLQRGK